MTVLQSPAIGGIAAAVADLSVEIETGRRHRVRVLDHVDLALPAGSVTALIGESGCGKSMVAAALAGLLPPGSHAAGVVRIGELELGSADRRWRGVRGAQVGSVPQSAATSLTPVRTLGSQLAEVVAALGGSRTPEQLCAQVGLPADALACYPHELSGGMAQRASVAAAIVAQPAVLVADEPTSALDPELAYGIWELLGRLADAGTAVLAITHDLETLTAADVASSVAVMRDGAIIATGTTSDCASSTQRHVADFFTGLR